MSRVFIAVLLVAILGFNSAEAQDFANKNWRLGITIPVVNVDSYQKEMWTGLSASYKGFTLNYYAVLTSEFLAEGSGEFQRRVSQPWEYTARMSFGYSYMFGKNEESNFNPIVGLYLLTMQGAEPDIDLGFRYKRMVFLLSPHLESRSNARWFPSFGRASSRNMILKFKVQVLL